MAQARRAALVAASVLLPVLGGAALALCFGQDATWDLRNYHWYNPFAFLTGRHGFDLMSAYPPTFFNPFADVPIWLAAQALPAKAVGAAIGAVQGLNGTILFWLGRTLLPAKLRYRTAAAALLALAGVTGAGAWLQIGTTYHDGALSVLANGALLGIVLLFGREASPRPLAIAVATLPAGLAVGLKLTMGPYALGALAAVLIATARRERLPLLLAALAGLAAGFAVTGGYWAWFLWERYGNPVFPYFSNLFTSPFAAPNGFRDTKFVPEGAMRRLFFPFVFTWNSYAASEFLFRDARLLIAFCLTVPALLLLGSARREAAAVLAYAASAYAAWAALFCIYRYAAGLEMLAPVLVLAALLAFHLAPRRAALGALGLAAVMALTTVHPELERVSWRPRFVVLEERPEIPADAIVLLLGEDPLAYVIPELSPAPRYLRLGDNFNLPPDQGFLGQALQAIAAHQGPLLALVQSIEVEKATAIAARHGLRLEPDCREIRTNLQTYPILLCNVRRQQEAYWQR